MAYQNFTDMLTEAKRRAQLAGRPLSATETAGIAEGSAAGASDRLFRAKQLEQQKSQYDQSLALEREKFDAERKAGEDARADQNRANVGSAVGGVAGAALGATAMTTGGAALLGLTNPVTAPVALGAMVVGSLLGKSIGGGCIIISACTDPHSYEVELSREYRDRFMDEKTLTGYYLIAGIVAPLIDRSKKLRAIFKRFLIDRLVDYGEAAVGIKAARAMVSSALVARGFLSLCRALGIAIDIILKRIGG